MDMVVIKISYKNIINTIIYVAKIMKLLLLYKYYVADTFTKKAPILTHFSDFFCKILGIIFEQFGQKYVAKTKKNEK